MAEEESHSTEIEETNAGEVEEQIKKLRIEKAADAKGVLAEMMKFCGESLAGVLAESSVAGSGGGTAM